MSWTGGSSSILASRASSRRSGSVCSILRSAILFWRRQPHPVRRSHCPTFSATQPDGEEAFAPIGLSHPISQCSAVYPSKTWPRERSTSLQSRGVPFHVACLELQRVGSVGGSHRGKPA